MLGNPLYDRGVFFQQFFIPLLGGVLYAGKEEPLINMEAFDDFFLVYLPKRGLLSEVSEKIFPLHNRQFCRLYAFQGKKARCPLIQAVE